MNQIPRCRGVRSDDFLAELGPQLAGSAALASSARSASAPAQPTTGRPDVLRNRPPGRRRWRRIRCALILADRLVMKAVPNRLICVRHEAHCYIARIAGMDWRRCLWI